MKNGSIVVVRKLPPKESIREDLRDSLVWLPVDDEKTTYVLRDGEMENGKQLFIVEEGVMGYNPYTKQEWALESDFFIEILPPEQQVNVEELVNVKQLCV